MNKWLIGISGFFIMLFFVGFLINSFMKQEETPKAELVLEIEQEIDSFARVTGPVDLRFPEDLAAHPEYLSEWWYYTGNLFSDSGRHFAYQLTFFRRALGNDVQMSKSAWATNQIYFAHFSIIDVEQQDHQAWEKFSRGALGLAGAVSDPAFEVWLNDWSVKQNGEDFLLRAATDGIELDLTLKDEKGIVLQGNNGYSQKGSNPRNASIYFSQTRLQTNGLVKMQNEEFPVNGYSWMDHEFGTSALGENQTGWDWFSIQLDNENEIMVYQIREYGNTISRFSGGSLIRPNGEIQIIRKEDFLLTPQEFWRNNEGIEYPIKWALIIPDKDISLKIEAVVSDQENRFSFFQYWEGAIQIEGTFDGNLVSGWGFLEMTGYASDMQGLF